MNTDHVKMMDITADVALMQCSHCGEQHCPVLPMPATLLADRLLGFVRMHRLCPKPVEPSPQLPLPGTGADPAKPWIPYEPPRDHFDGIDASTSDPAPEINPPPDMFREMYPMAKDVVELRHALSVVLDVSEMAKLSAHPLPNPSEPLFSEIAHWAGTDLARNDTAARRQRGEEPVAGLYIPTCRMPEALATMLNPAKKKRGARPRANPKPKKRRSGSTQHSG